MSNDWANVPPEYTPDWTYIGDGAYARFDGYQIWVGAGDGVHIYHPVALNPDTFRSLTEYAKRRGYNV